MRVLVMGLQMGKTRDDRNGCGKELEGQTNNYAKWPTPRSCVEADNPFYRVANWLAVRLGDLKAKSPSLSSLGDYLFRSFFYSKTF